MEVVYHEIDQHFTCEVKPLATLVLDEDLPDHHDTVALVLNFTLFKTKCYVNLSEGEDEENERTTRRLTQTIPDLHELDDLAIKLVITYKLYTHKIFEDNRFSLDLVVRKIADEVRKIRKSDSNKGPKVLRLKVDMERYYFLDVCECCTDDSKALLKTTLERARVITDDHDDDVDEEEDIGRNRSCVVRESEVCSICIDKFVGSKDVPSMPCLHVFHDECIGEWLGRNPNCPLCRFEWPKNKIEKPMCWDGTRVFFEWGC